MSIDKLPVWIQEIVAIIKETGAIGLAVIVVGFYLSQQAGWIQNVERADHHEIAIELREQVFATKMQTKILLENQKFIQDLVIQTKDNQAVFLALARGICISVTKTDEIERRCLMGLP